MSNPVFLYLYLGTTATPPHTLLHSRHITQAKGDGAHKVASTYLDLTWQIREVGILRDCPFPKQPNCMCYTQVKLHTPKLTRTHGRQGAS
jgi:hypothetical protein